MKVLKDILYKCRLLEVVGSTHLEVESIAFDSRKVTANSLFVAVNGVAVDGHQFIQVAIEKGAKAILCQELPEVLVADVTYVRVLDSSEALGFAASNFYDNPSEKLTLVGVTGTNGKTTVATLLFELFTELGYYCGLLSTVANRIGDDILSATHTTPDAIAINALLADMLKKGVTHCFMEVSSHAVHQNRIAGLDFNGAIFTNITHDHLDYHKTFQNYLNAKKGFFDGLSNSAFALVNKDDSHGSFMVQNSKAKKLTYALKTIGDYKCKVMENQLTGLQLQINGQDVWVRLIGLFNAYNVLAVYGTAVQLGIEPLEVLTALSNLAPVEGRFQYFKTTNNITAIVDYAHTPDALENVLKTVKGIRTGNETVYTVVGCGGDRDAAKRPIMAKVACTLSDKVILTSDNPRSEDPTAIIQQMQVGVEPQHFRKSLAIVDRKEAIKMACMSALPGDIILVAGKGHEKYQEISGVKYPFDDMQVLRELFDLITN